MRSRPFAALRRALVPALLLTGSAVVPVAAQTRPVPNPQLASKEINAKVDALLGR